LNLISKSPLELLNLSFYHFAFRLQPWAVEMLADKLRACILERNARVISYQWTIDPLSRCKNIRTTVGVTKNMYMYTNAAVASSGDISRAMSSAKELVIGRDPTTVVEMN